MSELNRTGACVAVGIFDGVHRGHQALLTTAVREARALGAVPTALTFDPHPATLFSPSRVPALLCPLDEREALLRAGGAERVEVLAFDRAFGALTPIEFARQILTDRLAARAVVVGADFRFGCNRSGDVETLRHLGEHMGFAVHVVDPVFVDGVPARSSVLRQQIAGGQVEAAARLLGRPFSRTGVVVRGRQLGRVLGWPTANLAAPDGLASPGAGVYAGRARVAAGVYAAAISVGANITIDEHAPPTVEAYLLDFDGDLYDQPLTLEFVERLRGMVKFDGLDALVEQIARDVDTTRRAILPL